MESVIECNLLFDGIKLIKDASVLIKGDKIVSIGKRGEFKESFPNPIQVEFLMPGLVDMHVHIAGYEEEAPSGVPFRPEKKFLRLLIYNGITTVRDVGNNLETIMYLKRWVEKYPAPMIYSSGPLLDKPPLMWAHSRIVTNSQEAKIEINRLYIEGVDLIKVYRNIPADVLKVIINEAHSKGLKVAGHLSVNASESARMGIDTLEHVVNLIDESYLNDEQKALLPKDRMKREITIWQLVNLRSDKVKQLIEDLVKNNVYICPTLLVIKRGYLVNEMFEEPNLGYMIPIMPYHKYFRYMQTFIGRLFGLKYMRKYGHINILSKEETKIAKESFQKMNEFIKILSENQVKIITGTDTPNPSIVPGFSLHEEMKLLVEAGLSSLQVLESTTSVPSQSLGKNDIGVIKPNAYANLVLINGNPIKDIKEISQIESVMLKGKLFKKEELAEKVDVQ